MLLQLMHCCSWQSLCAASDLREEPFMGGGDRGGGLQSYTGWVSVSVTPG